jgi:transcriptional regulator with XRE-family HTH domain
MLFPIGMRSVTLGRMRLVEKLEAVLRARGLTQSSFEKLASLSENRISKWKNDQGEPTVRQALRMARILDVPLDYLADDDLNDLPSATMTERERQVWEVVRTIGPDEAWRRLVGWRPAGNEPPGVWVGKQGD